MEHDKKEKSMLQESADTARIAELLTQVSGRIDSLERSLSGIEVIAKKLPAVMAVTTDAADEYYRETAKSGIDIDERFKKVSELLIQLTDPKKIDTISQFIEKIDNLTPLLEQLERMPDTLAVMVDSFDELCRNAQRSGLDLESIIKQGKNAAAIFNELLKSDELKTLMNSGILDPKAVSVVAQAGCALAECREDRPQKIGLIGLMKAIWNCDLQRALGFLISFGKRFGRLLNKN
ncbi:MAG: DUF1641 domain-containing protein [Candidatus Kuenenia sp.]|nr:DUF1641 domain-containing protein [Candidatus Kuenenia hertensis]